MKKTLKKALSLFLSVIMLVSTMSVGLGSIMAFAASVTVPSDDAHKVVIGVPETIYMKPSTGASQNGQYFVNNIVESNGSVTLATENAQTQGSIGIYAPGSTAISFNVTAVNGGIGDPVLGGSSTDAGASYESTKWDHATISGAYGTGAAQDWFRFDMLNLYINGTGLTAGNSALIEWAITVYYGANDTTGVTYYAYSTLYSPYYYPIGVATNAEANDLWAQSMAWVSGVHGFTANPSGQYYIGVTGETKNDEGEYSTKGTYYAKTTNKAMVPLIYGVETANDNEDGVLNWIQASAPGNGITVPTFRFFHLKYGGSSERSVMVVDLSPIANITVDTSRYTNFNQIPNLTVGFNVTDRENSDGVYWYASDYTDVAHQYTTADNGTTSGKNCFFNWTKRTKKDDITDYEDEWFNGTSTGTIYAGKANGTTSYHTGVEYNSSYDRTIVTGSSTYDYMFKGALHTYENHRAYSINYVQLRATNADKAALRKLVLEGSSLDSRNYTSASWEAYKTELRSAAQRLGNPTSSDVSTSNLTSKRDALQTNVYFNANGGTLNGASSALVTIGANATVAFNASAYTASRTGYTFKGWSTDKNATSGATTVTVGFNNTVYAVWEANKYNVVFDNMFDFSAFTIGTGALEINERTATGFTVTSTTGTDGNTGFSYAIPVTPGKTYVFSADVSIEQAAGDTRGFDMYINTLDANMAGEKTATVDTSNGAHKEGDVYISRTGQKGQQSGATDSYIRFTAGESTAYIKVRFDANTEGNKLTVNNIRVYEEGTIDTNAPYVPSVSVTYDGTYSNLPTPTRDGYEFLGWYKADGSKLNSTAKVDITDTLYVTSKWNRVGYTVTWKNYDGTVLETDTGVKVGTIPTFNKENPTKPADVQNTYTFTGWSPTVSAVTGDATYIAQFSQTTNKYNVTWKVDGKPDVVTSVEYGTVPAYPNGTPTKAADAQYTYTFAGWDNEVAAVTGDVTYTAKFSTTTNTYTVTWVDEDNSVLEMDENVPYGANPSYDSALPTKAANAQYTYEFDTWTPAVSAVTGHVTYTATYKATLNSYTVNWVVNNEIVETDTVEYGKTPTYDGETPTKAANAQYTYTFDKWSPTVTAVTGDVNYTATFTETVNTYTVTWKNEDGTVLETDEKVPYGTVPTYDGDDPTKAGNAQYSYTFDNWTETVVAVTGNVTYTAKYIESVNEYTVKWVDEDGTVLETDENVPYGTVPTYDSEDPTKAGNAQYSYTFDNWTEEVVAVTGDATYTAKYIESVNEYTVKWVNEDGTVLETDEKVPYGTVPTYDGEDPTKAATAKYTYTFDNWTEEVVEVTGNVTYTAKFKETVNKYSITWMANGEIIKVDEVEYDAVPVYVGETPTKQADAQYTYTFKDWSPAVVAVTGPATYVAVFDETVNTYTVTWENEDGTVLETDEDVPYGATPTYDGATPAKAKDAQYTYTFDKWSPEVSAVTGDVTYKATYTTKINTYTVTWKNENGNVLETDVGVEYGTMPSYDRANPTKATTAEFTYTFAGWDKELAEVTGDVTYTAKYIATTNEYTITWIVEGEEKTTTVKYGDTPDFGSTPTKAADAQYTYTFAGWKPEVAAVTGDATYTATFTETTNTYTVTWVDEDGTELEKDENVPYGATPSYDGDAPTKAGNAQYSYTFAGWDKKIETVEGDVTYTATYTSTVNKYTVTWVVDGKTAKEESVEYGTTPAFGEDPTKAADAQYTYTFAGWDKEIASVTENVTYTAVFDKTINEYTITWIVEGKETTAQVAYGDTPDFGEVPTKESTPEFTYEFAGWTPEVAKVTGDATYTATFTPITRSYTVTWVDDNGTKLYEEEILVGAAIPSKDVPAREGFIGAWETYPATMPAATLTIKAVYIEDGITVTWVIDDATTHQTAVRQGEEITPNDAWETKAPTVSTVYTFKGWSETKNGAIVTDFPVVTETDTNKTYYAVFEESAREYTITWVVDGETAKEEQVAYGTVPVFGADPTKEATAQYTYTFAGWDTTPVAVTGDATYTAKFTSTINEYTITWVVDGKTVREDTVEYGKTPGFGTNPTKEADAQYTYTFAGWDPVVSVVTGNATYTAKFDNTVNKYTVTWTNDDGSVIKTEEVEYGTKASYTGETPTKAANAQYTYTFAGWDKELAEVTGDVTYKATYTSTVNKYTVTWVNEDGTVLETDTDVAYGTMPSYDKANPTKAANAQYTYTFAGWDKTVAEVAGNVTYKATYTSTVNKYTVTWVVEGTTVETDAEVPYGTEPEFNGKTPTKTGNAQYSYVFTGWTPDVSNVTGNATYTATFAEVTNEYTVKWIVEGTTVETDEHVPYGTEPTFNGSTPTKAADVQYTYTFAGWDPAVSDVTGDVTYTATFNKTVNKYTVTWANDDGSVIKTEEVEYGTMASYTGATPEKAATAQYTYTFKAWDKAFAVVEGDVTYTATYTSTVNKYTVTWVVEGTTVETDTDVPYGTDPSYDGDEPTKAGNAQYTYAFAGWDAELSEVTGNVTYTAKFTQTVNEYTITWIVNGEKTTDQVAYGTVPSFTGSTDKAPTNTTVYTFAGWNKEVVAVTGDATYEATYTESAREYTITWIVDGKETTEKYAYNAVPSFKGSTDIPSTESTTYVFTGWDPEVTAVTEDATYTAQYDITVKTHTITWIVGDQEIKQQWAYGEVPVFEGSTDKAPSATATYTFAGWDKTPVAVTGDATYTATYTEAVRKYTVVWYVDGQFFATQDVAYNTVIPNPGLPAEKEGYTVRWDNTVTVMPAGDVEINAIYTPKMYPVYWIVDGITVFSESVPFGGTIPSKPVPVKDGHSGKWINVPETMPAGPVTIEAEYAARTYSVYWKIGDTQSTGTAVYGTDYVLTFDIETLPEELRITVGGVVLSEESYNYDSVAGTLTISGSAITGNINIVAKSSSGSVNVVSSIFNGTSSNADEIISVRQTYHTTITPAAGYLLPKNVSIYVDGILVTSGYSYDSTTGKLTINAEVIVGELEIYAECPVNPDYSPSDNCDCSCHSKNALIKFFFAIFNFLRQLFGMEQYHYCECGVAHW